VAVDRPTPTRGATAPLFFVLAAAQSKAAFQIPGMAPDFKSGKCWRKLTPKIAKELNAQDRKKLQKKNKD
jgi:hypothetical protein